MLKKTFYLFSVLLLFFGATTSCGNKTDCGGTAPIMWGNNNVATFENIKLSVSGTYYKMGFTLPGEEVLSPSKPITDFYQALTRPGLSGSNQHYLSRVEVRTYLRDDCKGTDFDRGAAKQFYEKVNPPHPPFTNGNGSALPAGAIDYAETVSPTFGAKSFTICRATNRNPRAQRVYIDITSGRYADADDNWYYIRWFKTYYNTTIDEEKIVISPNGEVKMMRVPSLNSMGTAVNVKPNKPFINPIYINGAKVVRTFENVSTTNNLMTLTVK